MRVIPALLKTAILEGKIANLIKIDRVDGQSYHFTDHDFKLTVDGDVYTPAPGLNKTTMQSTTDLTVSNQEFSASWLDFDHDDLQAGLFDSAEITVKKCSWEDTSLGSITVFYGNLGIIQWTDDGFKADIHSLSKKLFRNYGIVTTASCRHRLFSQLDAISCGACTLVKSNYTYTGSVNAITHDRIKFDVTGTFPTTDGYCSFAEIEFTSGLNAGTSFEVARHNVATFSEFELTLQTPYEISVGDSFTVTAGCNKTFDTCKDKFANGKNFGGFPHIQSEIMYR